MTLKYDFKRKGLINMKCRILHESRGRMRVRMLQRRMTVTQADKLHYYLQAQEEITKVTVSERTMDVTIYYKEKAGVRESVIQSLADFGYDRTEAAVPEHTGRELNRTYEDKLFSMVMRRTVNILVLPSPGRHLFCLGKAVRYLGMGLRCLMKGRLEVPVLDATTISVSLLRGDYATAGSIMFLLDAGGLLEEWTHKKSVDDLARRMYLNVDKAWVKTPDQEEILVPVSDIKPGDVIVVRTGNVIPL